MRKVLVFFLFSFYLPLVFAGSAAGYLVEIGRGYLNQGRTKEARLEFEKALQADPANRQAKKHLAELREKEIQKTLDHISERFTFQETRQQTEVYSFQPSAPTEPVETKPQFSPPAFDPSSFGPISEDEPKVRPEPDTLASSEIQPVSSRHQPERAAPEEVAADEAEADDSPFYFKGDYQLSFGVESGDFIWKRADGDLTEKNWRILSEDAYNRYQNTFDPAIFSQLRFETGYAPGEGVGFHTYIDISPWSFIGKSDKVRIDSDLWGVDSVDLQLKYWANTRYAVGEVVYTNFLGDSFALGEHKVRSGRVASFSQGTLFGNVFDIPELKIKREFWPLRELWFDFASDNTSLRVFPAALQDQAYTSDDPLRLSNRHIWWAPSPWLTQWESGRFIPNDDQFFKGFWDDALAFRTRTSALERITNLRGFSLRIDRDNSLFNFTAASPKNLWQDYDVFDTLNLASRSKYFFGDALILGLTTTSKYGFDSGQDAFNHVFGADISFGLTDKSALSLEVATSRSEYDRKYDYKEKGRGNVYHLNLVHASSDVFGKDFFAVRPEEEDDPFYRIKLSFTRMDSGFDAALADYHDTRDDEFWSRHITFRRQLAYEYFGLYGPPITEADQLYPFRIGDGIDSGRNVVSLRWEAENIINQNLDLLFDIRDVRANTGGLIENVSRLQGTYRITPRLRLRGLGIYHHLPKTRLCEYTGEGIDPFMSAGNSRRQRPYYLNSSVEEGKDPSLKTFSVGFEYDFLEWLSANFVWERSNDTTLAYDNFPRGVFEWSDVDIYTQNNKVYREQIYGLYNTEFFPTPPYPYYNIFKVGLHLEPVDDLEIYLSYTKNEYNWAQIIDDNMNHIGLEAAYIWDNKIGIYLRYVYSRANNLRELFHHGVVTRTSHHGVFSELVYRMDEKSELVTQYGVGGYGDISTMGTYTPFGGGVAALDTQHIVRVYYRRKF